MTAAVFLFRAGRRERLAAAGPTEFLYGYAELARDGAPVAMFDEIDLGLDRPFNRLLEGAANRFAQLVGFHARIVARLLARRRLLRGNGTLVATTHTLGFALAMMRRLGAVRESLVIMTMGIVPTGASPVRLRWLRWLLGGTTLAVLSKPEAIWLRTALGEHVDIIDFTFGVDLEFWRPATGGGENFAISVGNDWNRDFATLVDSWRPHFPPLEIITSLPVTAGKSNIRVTRGDWRKQVISDEDLRARLQRARLVVVPLHDTLQPSGQSAALQAMACGRPVILTENRGCWDRQMLARHHACRFVAPGDSTALANAIEGLLAERAQAEAMGARARRMLEQEDVSARAMADQFRAIIPALRTTA